jgi:hypothetical protein
MFFHILAIFCSLSLSIREEEGRTVGNIEIAMEEQTGGIDAVNGGENTRG